MKKSQNLTQQVNKNCYSLACVPTNVNLAGPYGQGLCKIGGDDGAVESNADLIAYYDRLFGNQFNNFLIPLNFRGCFPLPFLFRQIGLPISSNNCLSNYFINKKARVVKTTLEGTAMVTDVSPSGDILDFRPMAAYPCDVWQSNGVGAMSKEITLTLKISSPVSFADSASTSTWSNGQTQKLESNEPFWIDNKTVIAFPWIGKAVPVVPPFPPAITAYATGVAISYSIAGYYMATFYIEVEDWVKNYDHVEMPLAQALQENKIIIEQNPDIFNPVYKPLTQTEKENIIIIDNL